MGEKGCQFKKLIEELIRENNIKFDIEERDPENENGLNCFMM
jgi:hypothetical protein